MMRTRLGSVLLMAGCSAVTGIAFAQAPLAAGFDIENHSQLSVVRAFAKPQSAQKWGSPLPNSSVAASSTGSVKVASETNCLYDVRLEFSDGHAEERLKVDVCKHERIQLGSPQPRS